MVYVSRDLSSQVAKMVVESGELDSVAEEVIAEAKILAERHHVTGELGTGFGIDATKAPKSNLETPTAYNDAPSIIPREFGHISKLPNLEGREVWVQGLHIMRNAALAVAARHGFSTRRKGGS